MIVGLTRRLFTTKYRFVDATKLSRRGPSSFYASFVMEMREYLSITVLSASHNMVRRVENTELCRGDTSCLDTTIG